MTFPAITRSLQNKLRVKTQRNDYSGLRRPFNQVWNSIPKNFRDRYTFTGIFFAVIFVVLVIIILAGPVKP